MADHLKKTAAEKVLLAIVDLKTRGGWPVDQIIYEMKELVKACHGEVAGVVLCPVNPPDASTYIRQGKLLEIAALVPVLSADIVIFSEELKGHHQRNLEEQIGVRVLDRTALILDIFARRATSQEGKLQVELAQLQYRLPRLTGAYEALSRQGGGIGTSGPGETKLETDRRRIGERIDRIKKDLLLVTRSRDVKRKRREGRQVPLIALVGYTNAGKSTLLNALTHAGQVTRDGLFTTLDSLSRRCVLSNRQEVVFSDTVGFMHALPHNLIEAFKATLEEVSHADLLLHVVDVSHPLHLDFKAAVDVVLAQLAVVNKPTIIVFNKIDQLADQHDLVLMKNRFRNSVVISARENLHMEALLAKIEEALAERVVALDIFIPMERMDLVRLAHKEGNVRQVTYTPEGVQLNALVPVHLRAAFDCG